MSDQFFIQIVDGQPVGHAVHPDNLRMLGIDPNAPAAALEGVLRENPDYEADGFAPYVFSPAPALHPLEAEYYEPPIKVAGGKWTRERRAVRRSEEECAAITAQHIELAEQEKVRRLAVASSRAGRSAAWADQAKALAAVDVTKDPFAIEWPQGPDEIKKMGVTRV